MEPLSIAVSFLVSYIANCLPTLLDTKAKTISSQLKKCYQKAVDAWNVSQEVKDVSKNKMEDYLLELKDFISHKPRGYHPKEYELLELWARFIINDPIGYEFVVANQTEIIQNELSEGLLKADDMLKALNLYKQEIERLSSKIDSLKNRGVTEGSQYWDKWATGENGLRLNYDIVLSGRNLQVQQVLRACETPMVLYIESSSIEDSIAFAVSSILKYKPEYKSKIVVIEDAESYSIFVDEAIPSLLVTTALENHNYAVSKGYSVLCCITPKVSARNKITLPAVDRDGFRESLLTSGMDSNAIRHLSIDTYRDTTALRRFLGIQIKQPEWQTAEELKYLIPALLAGSWDSNCINDTEIIEELSGLSYDVFETAITDISIKDESPILKVGTIWRIKSPRLLMSRCITSITSGQFDKYKECLDIILEDDDPDAIAKKRSIKFQFWQDKHVFSTLLRESMVKTLALISVTLEEKSLPNDWVDVYVEEKLKDFRVERYLSDRHYIKWMAEASPSAFLSYLDSDISKGSSIISEIFKVKHSEYNLTGSEIYYSDLLFCLENIAWSPLYLSHVTELLLSFCSYSNESNYSNSPISSLYEIYRFLLPQTLAKFDLKYEILQTLMTKYKIQVCDLCFKMLDGLTQTVFMPTSHFQWRYVGEIRDPKYIEPVPSAHVVQITNLLLDNVEFSEKTICRLLELSAHRFLDSIRELILQKVNPIISSYKGNDIVLNVIRNIVKHHQMCKSAIWALTEAELAEYEELIEKIESDDVIEKNKHFFDDFLIQEPELDDFEKEYPLRIKESISFRSHILESIISERGLDGVWELLHKVGRCDTVADALIELRGDSDMEIIYNLYGLGTVPKDFVKKYYLSLYYKYGKTKYLEYFDTLKKLDISNISIVLYAPDVKKELLDIVITLPEEIQKEYWTSVNLWGYDKTEIEIIVDSLRKFERYSPLIQICANNEVGILISDETKLNILLETYSKGHLKVLTEELHYVAVILEKLPIPENDSEQIQLIQLELILLDGLRHIMDISKLHIIGIVNREPDLMAELAKYAYSPDDGTEESWEQFNASLRISLAKLSWGFFYNYKSVPGINSDGKIDSQYLKQYIDKLQISLEKVKRVHAMPLIVGKILGNVPESEDYPSDWLCEIVESLNSDNVDREIECCLSNRRGMTTRMPFDGGDIEREHVKTFERYKEKVSLKSQRMARIFDNEIKNYKAMAKYEDEHGKLRDLMY